MAISFDEFKKKLKASKGEMLENLKKETTSSNFSDDRFYYPQTDKSGNALVRVRFLPQKDPSKSPIALLFRHSFQKDGRWFISYCPKSKDTKEPCPICEYASSVWDDDDPETRKFWRGKERIVNILVKDDKNNPENNGKVFLYKLPATLYNKIMAKIEPEDGEEPLDVFDFFEGYDFKIKITQKGGYNNYELSEFYSKPTPVAEDEEKMKEIFNAIYDLDEYKSEIVEKIKTYDELKKIFNKFMFDDTFPVENIEKEAEKKVKKEEKTTKHDEDDDWDDDFDDDVFDDDDI